MASGEQLSADCAGGELQLVGDLGGAVALDVDEIHDLPLSRAQACKGGHGPTRASLKIEVPTGINVDEGIGFWRLKAGVPAASCQLVSAGVADHGLQPGSEGSLGVVAFDVLHESDGCFLGRFLRGAVGSADDQRPPSHPGPPRVDDGVQRHFVPSGGATELAGGDGHHTQVLRRRHSVWKILRPGRGIFWPIVDASVQQMQAYAERLRPVAKCVSWFTMVKQG